MAAWRFPCRVCGVPTDGVDSYVICTSCLADLDAEARHDRPLPPHDEPVEATLSAGEAEAQLRKLLDDW